MLNANITDLLRAGLECNSEYCTWVQLWGTCPSFLKYSNSLLLHTSPHSGAQLSTCACDTLAHSPNFHIHQSDVLTQHPYFHSSIWGYFSQRWLNIAHHLASVGRLIWVCNRHLSDHVDRIFKVRKTRCPYVDHILQHIRLLGCAGSRCWPQWAAGGSVLTCGWRPGGCWRQRLARAASNITDQRYYSSNTIRADCGPFTCKYVKTSCEEAARALWAQTGPRGCGWWGPQIDRWGPLLISHLQSIKNRYYFTEINQIETHYDRLHTHRDWQWSHHISVRQTDPQDPLLLWQISARSGSGTMALNWSFSYTTEQIREWAWPCLLSVICLCGGRSPPPALRGALSRRLWSCALAQWEAPGTSPSHCDHFLSSAPSVPAEPGPQQSDCILIRAADMVFSNTKVMPPPPSSHPAKRFW